MPFSIDRDADTPLVEQFVAGVCAAVGSGHFRRGDKLPTIEEWAEWLGVGSWVPRKGLARLVEERLVVVKKHVGAVVLGEAPLAPKGRILYVTIDTGNLYSRNVMAFWMGHVCANAGYRFDHVSVPSTPCGGDEFARLEQVLYDGENRGDAVVLRGASLSSCRPQVNASRPVVDFHPRQDVLVHYCRRLCVGGNHKIGKTLPKRPFACYNSSQKGNTICTQERR